MWLFFHKIWHQTNKKTFCAEVRRVIRMATFYFDNLSVWHLSFCCVFCMLFLSAMLSSERTVFFFYYYYVCFLCCNIYYLIVYTGRAGKLNLPDLDKTAADHHPFQINTLPYLPDKRPMVRRLVQLPQYRQPPPISDNSTDRTGRSITFDQLPDLWILYGRCHSNDRRRHYCRMLLLWLVAAVAAVDLPPAAVHMAQLNMVMYCEHQVALSM